MQFINKCCSLDYLSFIKRQKKGLTLLPDLHIKIILSPNRYIKIIYYNTKVVNALQIKPLKVIIKDILSII